jgi:hypothetical protein
MILLDAVTATDATKVEFSLNGKNFRGSSLPELKATTMVAGDSISVFEDVNGVWELRTTLDETTRSTSITSIGRYAISVIVVAVGPISLKLSTSGSLPKYAL